MLQFAAAGTFVVYLITVWTGTWAAGLIGSNYYIVAGLLSALGITGYGIFEWFTLRKQRKAEEAAAGGGGEAGNVGSGDIDTLLREAEGKLAASKTAPGAKIANLPVIFIAGDQGSTKTSTMVNSGLEPELLAGQVYQDNAVVPTPSANIWLARQTLFVESGGATYRSPAAWSNLIKKLMPGKMKAGNASMQAPRAALVCIDTEAFAKPGASEAMTQVARGLQARLGQISQSFGISFPVYVLFTRTDRVPFFAEFFRNLTNEESTQVCGATVAMRTETGGVYAEEETRRLSHLFDQLFYSFCDKRIHYLSREHEADKLPAAYEFPREFRKLRGMVVQFLVEMCRPSQLRTNPVLRGFYFSGVRPVYVSDAAPVTAAAPPSEGGHEPLAGATRMFRAGMQQEMAKQAVAAARVSGARKVPQWVFLSHLFNDIILADRDALGLSGASFKTAVGQRVLYSVLAVLFWFLTLGFLISFVGNRSLENEALTAARALPRGPALQALAPVDTLQKLDTLRQSVDKLGKYVQDGPPFRLRWFLFTGEELYPEVRCIYYQRLQQIMLSQTQASVLAALQRLPLSPTPTDEYAPVYDSLKAHLITTTNRDKSSAQWLTPVLMRHWTAGKQVEPEQEKLARAQFDFFSEDLKSSPPCYAASGDPIAVERARRYLSQFSGMESVYRFMLADASRRNPPANYNKEIAGSEAVFINNRDVDGAFTVGGWNFMQGALKKAGDYFGGEEWVLGSYKPATIDRAKLEKDLTDRYVADFIKAWRQYLKNTTFKGYVNLPDAAQKLETMSSNTTPLLAIFWLASKYSCVGDPRVNEALQPIHTVVPCPAKTVQYIQPVTTPYVQSLTSLQAVVDKASQTPNDPAAANSTRPPADAARQQTRQIAQAFMLDNSEYKTHEQVKKILDDPITSLEAMVRGMGPDQLNAAGRSLCAQFSQLTNKFPFNPDAKTDATLAEMAALLKPKEGAIWTFYEQRLKTHLKREGPDFAPSPESPFPMNPGFVNWFNQVVRFSESVYPAGAADPKLVYTLQAQPSDQIQSMRLNIDGQGFNYSGTSRGASATFTWPGTGKREANVEAVLAGGSATGMFQQEGLWAVFHFFAEADSFSPVGSGYMIEWRPVSGQRREPMRVGGKPLVYRFLLDTKGAPPVFSKSYLTTLRCVSPAAR